MTLPAGADPRDLLFVAVPTTIAAPAAHLYDPGTRALWLIYDDAGPTVQQVAALQSLANTNPQSVNAPWRIVAADLGRLSGVVAVLRNQAQLAASTTVTSGNAVAVLQTVVNDLAVFCARLADLIESFGID